MATIWADTGEIEKEREAADGDRRRHTHSDSGVRRRLSHVRQKTQERKATGWSSISLGEVAQNLETGDELYIAFLCCASRSCGLQLAIRRLFLG